MREDSGWRGAGRALTPAHCTVRLQEGEELRALPCRHVFCRECIDAWITKQARTRTMTRTMTRMPARGDRHCFGMPPGDGWAIRWKRLWVGAVLT